MEGSTERFVITGLGGKRVLSGSIAVNGAKNSALKAIAASVLFRTPLVLENVPDIEDVLRMTDLLEHLGIAVSRPKDHTLSINAQSISKSDLAHDISKRLRASIVLSGPLLARQRSVIFPHPGGCVIGARPIDLFLEGFKKMGATVRVREKAYSILAPNGLSGATIFCRVQSVTATETFMMAGVLARGTTLIKNAAMEPEIAHLAEFLNRCGAKISGAGTTTMTIKGGKLLSAPPRTTYTIVPDRIETGSFLILGALAARDLMITNIIPEHVESIIETLQYTGVSVIVGKRSLRVRAPKKAPRSMDIKTHEYPGFPTDIQAPMTVFLTQAEGEGMVFETIFEGRLKYVDELNRMGADIRTMDPHRAIVKGPTPLHGREMESPDLRAGLAFVIAAAIASGQSVVHNIYNIDRGYERVEERLRDIGVKIERVVLNEV